MANRNLSGFTHAIHTLFEVGTLGGQSDGQLLEQFAARKSEAAFATLVARHGPMVLSVCESLLGDAHDAEDAFQAAFLILAKKARSIRDPDLLGNWLYGVARRTAQKAKAQRARRRVREGREEAMCSIAIANGLAEIESVGREETAMLHEEVDRLPESLRAPIVLCYLEGLTHGEAALRLRWPIGTVRSRMARARGLLRARLTRRGLAYAAIVAAIESPRAVRAEVPQALAHTTTRSAIELATGTASGLVSTPAATLMKEVLQVMFMTQLKRIVATALAVLCIATGAGIIAMGALQLPPSGAQGAQAAQAADQRAMEGNRAGPTPQARELLALQERIRSVARTTSPAIVSFIGATGVIITPEGMILTQAHVTHPENARPGTKIKVILHDGTRRRGRIARGGPGIRPVASAVGEAGPLSLHPPRRSCPRAGRWRAEAGLSGAAGLPEGPAARGSFRPGAGHIGPPVPGRLPDQRRRFGRPVRRPGWSPGRHPQGVHADRSMSLSQRHCSLITSSCPAAICGGPARCRR